MINKELSKKILTVGPRYKIPLGGIAQLMYNYRQDAFEEYRVIVNSGSKLPLRKAYYLISGLIKFLALMIFDWRIRIVHIHTASNNSFRRSSFFVFLTKVFFRKVILHIHSGDFFDYYDKKKNYIDRVLNMCETIIVLTPMWKKMLIEASGHKNIQVLGNIIPKPFLSKEHYNDNVVHFLFMARITEAKGVFDLLKTVFENHELLENRAIFHIAGKGMNDELVQKINEYNISDLVKYEGWVSGAAKNSLLNKCDIFILPTHFEALSLSILEAMSYRKPIIATRVGGIPSIVEHNYNGLLFEKGDFQNMINHIMYFIEHPDKITEMGSNSEIIVSQYYPESIVPKLQDIYESLL